jgi:hypothetical protein
LGLPPDAGRRTEAGALAELGLLEAEPNYDDLIRTEYMPT